MDQHYTNGFEIAEQDFLLRGPGEMWGTRQSGFKAFKLADLMVCLTTVVSQNVEKQ